MPNHEGFGGDTERQRWWVAAESVYQRTERVMSIIERTGHTLAADDRMFILETTKLWREAELQKAGVPEEWYWTTFIARKNRETRIRLVPNREDVDKEES